MSDEKLNPKPRSSSFNINCKTKNKPDNKPNLIRYDSRNLNSGPSKTKSSMYFPNTQLKRYNSDKLTKVTKNLILQESFSEQQPKNLTKFPAEAIPNARNTCSDSDSQNTSTALFRNHLISEENTNIKAITEVNHSPTSKESNLIMPVNGLSKKKKRILNSDDLVQNKHQFLQGDDRLLAMIQDREEIIRINFMILQQKDREIAELKAIIEEQDYYVKAWYTYSQQIKESTESKEA